MSAYFTTVQGLLDEYFTSDYKKMPPPLTHPVRSVEECEVLDKEAMEYFHSCIASLTRYSGRDEVEEDYGRVLVDLIISAAERSKSTALELMLAKRARDNTKP